MKLPQAAWDAIQVEIDGLQAQIEEYQKLLAQDAGDPGVKGKNGKSKLSPEQQAKQAKAVKAYWKKKKAEKAKAAALAGIPPGIGAEDASPVGLGETEFTVTKEDIAAAQSAGTGTGVSLKPTAAVGA